jgi:hypothetical protein
MQGGGMRIFLTFASEQRDIAESILLALRNRGHKVFFSHDDLPPGDSFDLRIQKAIASSELLIFLISPESVTRGRYTLTELAFARDQWRSPRGRLLPVVVAPVPMASMPNYLKAVTVLEPEGNIAAETAAAVDQLHEQSRSRSTLVFGLLGFVTGALSYFTFRYPLPHTTFSFLLRRPGDATTVLPGIIFGFLVAVCVHRYGVRERFLFLVTFMFTVIAWILAYDSTFLAYSTLLGYKKNVSTSQSVSTSQGGVEPPETSAGEATQESAPPPSRVEDIPYLGAMSGIVGGFVGGFVTIFGISVATSRYRQIEPWMTTIAVSTVLGMLVETIRFGPIGYFVLFTIWQAAVIAFISRGLTFGEEVRDL